MIFALHHPITCLFKNASNSEHSWSSWFCSCPSEFHFLHISNGKHIFCNCCYFACAIFFATISILKKKNNEISTFPGPQIWWFAHTFRGFHTKRKKNKKDFNQNWKQFFFVLCAHMHVRSKTTVIISIFGMLDFVSD